MGTFWNQAAADPKRKFRWTITFTGDNGESLQIAVKTVDKPKFEISNTPHKFINHTFYFPGRLEWKPINLTFVDLASSDGGAGEDVSKILDSLIRESYKLPEGAGVEACTAGITKLASVNALGSSFIIQQLDGEGEAIEKWELRNSWISAIEYGSLDYASEDLVDMSVTVIYDYAVRTL